MPPSAKTEGAAIKWPLSSVNNKAKTVVKSEKSSSIVNHTAKTVVKSEKKRKWFWILMGVSILGFLISLIVIVSNEYVPLNKRLIYANNSDIQAIITYDDNLGVAPPGYVEHKVGTVTAALYFNKVPTLVKDVKLSSDTKSIMTVKNGTMELYPKNLTSAIISKASALTYVGKVEVGHSLEAKNFTENYSIDIFYRTNMNDTGPLQRMSVNIPWNITALDFGQLTYFFIIFAGVLLSRVFTFSRPSGSGVSSKITTTFTHLELIWVPFSAVITLLIFSSFNEQTKLGPNIIGNIALAFGFGFGFDKIFETWAKSPSRGEDASTG